ncbi:Hypothetical protein PENO1_098450 [Penicillium occitanis (nom. inval.)]|nr:Hypothetical protein PENO1_098450 [Penicillium occitanis (nom. inval.)]PCG92785.1 hypothetical protein PENOC_090790 [Penicillium occitanis (nom. inval.)]
MTNAVTVAPYGKWDSPITAEYLSGDSIHFEGIQSNSRPTEGGRFAVVEITEDIAKDVLPAEYSAMGSIHEYGGGSIAMHPDGRLLFTNHPKNGIFLLDPASGEVEMVVAPDATVRFGNFSVHPKTQEWILAVQETHTKDSQDSTTVKNSIVAIHVPTAKVTTIVEGADFYQHPQFNPDGSQLYRFDGLVSKHICLNGLQTAEFGSREPCLGNCTYIQLDEKTLVASANKSATSNLILIDISTYSWKDLSLPIVDIQKNAIARVTSSSFAVIGSTRTSPQALYRVDLGDTASIKLLKSTIQLDIPESIISEAQHITFPRIYSKGTTGFANAWLVEPKNNAFKGIEGTKPPLLVWMHGGPTYHVPPGLSLTTQYWTSRGYAYVLVNHVGSTGYGRAYREMLDGQWGAADIEDAASCVAFLNSERIIDPSKVGIVGESAGGYAVMQALYIYPEIWAAGISIYGISSLSGFAETTHKFESHYIDSLVLGKGEKSQEEIEAIYKGRSALYHAENIRAPLLLLQGDVDTIVPASQATQMEERMHELGKEIQVVMFEGEGHGFHMSKTIRASTEIQTEFWLNKLL